MTDTPYNKLVERFGQLGRIGHAMTFLQWDQLVMMPPGGNETRGEALAELASMRHELLADKRTGELITEALIQEKDPFRLRSLHEMEREWRQAACLPSSLVKAKSLAGTRCEHGWRTQRKENDWEGFLSNFKEVVELSREEAKLRQEKSPHPVETPYDALLELYCTGDESGFIQQVFDTLKEELPGLISEIVDSQPQPVSLAGNYPIDDQKRLNEKLMEYLGFDFSSGRLDVSMHPFSTGDRGDQRITTRFRNDDFADALQGTAHETGHASYESGLPKEWDNLPIGSARNMCLHESQSLLFEKQIFLSKSFTTYFASAIHEFLPDARRFDEENLWRSMTVVRPSFIRVEADEVTYPLHVILRFEIESGLINGDIEVEDIPELWDQKMKQYLGLSTAGNFKDGCLQDIHWTDGSFGYFPSYTLGALNSAQLFAAVRKEYPQWQDSLAKGDVQFVRNWLKTKIWSVASSMDSQEIMRRATGEGTNPAYFLDHIRSRYLQGLY